MVEQIPTGRCDDGATMAVTTAATFVDVLAERTGRAFEFVAGGTSSVVGRADLDARARSVGAALADRGLGGQRVLVELPVGPAFVEALFGCLYAGAVAVPVAPGRAASVRASCAPAAAVADRPVPGVPTLSIVDLLAVPAESWRRPAIGPDSLALVCYGDDPTRGIMVSHANLLAGCRQLARMFGTGADAGVVSWLPPYRDLGLLVGVLYPVFAGGWSTMLPTAEFLAAPGRWPELVASRSARVSGGPGWALDRCTAVPGLDLSTWDFAVTAADAASMSRFAGEFAAAGFRAESFFPCYWRPETMSPVTGRRAASVTSFAADSLAPGRSARVAAAGVPVPDRGAAAAEVEIAIVDPLTATRCPDGTAGEIWVSGPAVAVGYLGRPVDSEHTFCARLRGSRDNFLRTGDLGFVHRGGLHVPGLAA